MLEQQPFFMTPSSLYEARLVFMFVLAEGISEVNTYHPPYPYVLHQPPQTNAIQNTET